MSEVCNRFFSLFPILHGEGMYESPNVNNFLQLINQVVLWATVMSASCLRDYISVYCLDNSEFNKRGIIISRIANEFCVEEEVREQNQFSELVSFWNHNLSPYENI